MDRTASRDTTGHGVLRAAVQTPPPDDGDDHALAELLQTVLGAWFVPGHDVTLLRNGDEIFPAMLEAIAGARSRIDLLTYVYWSGDIARRVADALSERARAGVAVRVVFPDRHNDSRLSLWAGRETLGALLRGGVRVFHYRPTMLHTKQVTVDGRVTAIGSPNWNHRSMGKDDEVCLVIRSAEVTAQAMAHFEDDLARSVELHHDDWARRGTVQRIQERLARLCKGSV